MLSRARHALVRSQCMLRGCKRSAVRTSSPYLLESPRTIRTGKFVKATSVRPIVEIDSDEEFEKQEEDSEDEDLDTSSLDILLRTKPALVKR